jgi:hypothetical protein
LEDDFYQEVGRLTMDILGSNMMEINDTTIHSLATGNVINKLLDNNINIYQNYWETLPELKQFEEMINDVMNIVECQD